MSYEGDFQEGEMHGYGRIEFTNGDAYVGSIQNSKFNGYGHYTFGSGNQVGANLIILLDFWIFQKWILYSLWKKTVSKWFSLCWGNA
jgi:hypothetical protein